MSVSVASYCTATDVVVVTDPTIVSTTQVPRVQRSVASHDDVIGAVDRPGVNVTGQGQPGTSEYCTAVQQTVQTQYKHTVQTDTSVV